MAGGVGAEARVTEPPASPTDDDRRARMGDATAVEPAPLPDPPEWHRDEEGDDGDR